MAGETSPVCPDALSEIARYLSGLGAVPCRSPQSAVAILDAGSFNAPSTLPAKRGFGKRPLLRRVLIDQEGRAAGQRKDRYEDGDLGQFGAM